MGAGYSWADIALRLGITRQAAQQRRDTTPGPDHDHDGPGTIREPPVTPPGSDAGTRTRT